MLLLAPMLFRLALGCREAADEEVEVARRREAEVVVEEYATARKSRPIFQRGTIAAERPSDHLKYLVAGRKLSDPAN